MSSDATAFLESTAMVDEGALLQLLQSPDVPWIEKGQAYQCLYLGGVSAKTICESTGLEPHQQTQMIEAAQVFSSLLQGNAPRPVLAHFETCHCQILYEFRHLTQTERVHAATLAVAKHLDAAEAKLVAEAIQAFTSFAHPPSGFSEHSGDAVAYQCWGAARQEGTPQVREQLIARGLRFAHSDGARRQLEALLVSPTNPPGKS